jgi:hypothetical protein
MAKNLTIVVPHSLGKQAAMRRLRDGVAGLARSDLSRFFTLERQDWNDDGVNFQVRAMGKDWNGQIAIADDHAMLTLPMPWYVAPFAARIETQVRKHGGELFSP